MAGQKILVISGSARRKSDTMKYIKLVFESLTYTNIELVDHIIHPYDYTEEYPADDGFLNIAMQMLAHDTIVFATPVYWYAMSGRLKTFFDRMTDLMHVHKAIGKKFKGKHLFLLAVSASETWPLGFDIPFSETAGYFDMHYGGSIYFNSEIPEADRATDIQEFIKKLNQAV
jgi:multimeric flavodoxin WrbA